MCISLRTNRCVHRGKPINLRRREKCRAFSGQLYKIHSRSGVLSVMSGSKKQLKKGSSTSSLPHLAPDISHPGMPATKPTFAQLRSLLLILVVLATLLPLHQYVLTSPRFHRPYPSTSSSSHHLPSASNSSSTHNQQGHTPPNALDAAQSGLHEKRTSATTEHSETAQLNEPSAKSDQATRPSSTQGREPGADTAPSSEDGWTSIEHAQTNSTDTHPLSSTIPAAANTQPRPSACASLIVYDKPMKTGSTAVTQALKRLLTLRQTNATFAVCERAQCQQLARAICAGEAEPQHLLQHMDGEHGLLECLRHKGYYVMTSIREPLDRWESAYLYNQRERANHYGISWRESYDVFMSRFPPCALLGYYDGGDRRCGDGVEERIDRIVQRYDEIVDLYDEPRGQVERLVQQFVREVNKSPRDEHFRNKFDRQLLENETKLYEALKKRREQLVARPPSVLCEEA